MQSGTSRADLLLGGVSLPAARGFHVIRPIVAFSHQTVILSTVGVDHATFAVPSPVALEGLGASAGLVVVATVWRVVVLSPLLQVLRSTPCTMPPCAKDFPVSSVRGGSGLVIFSYPTLVVG